MGREPGALPLAQQRRPAPIYTQGVFQMTRLEKLKYLETQLEAALGEAETKELASLARQYRETLREIAEIEGAEQNDDDISEILSERAAAGKSGAVR